MRIVDLLQNDNGIIRQVADLLVEAFAPNPSFVKTPDAALSEVIESFGPGHVSRVELDANGNAEGWVGGIEQYNGLVYELDPLAVKPSSQGHGTGRALARDCEEQARKRGAMTVILGTDDEIGGTSLFGADVYPDVCAHISSIRNVAIHPYEFYKKCGYAIVGLVPDANGFGKPDILMAKRIGIVEGRR